MAYSYFIKKIFAYIHERILDFYRNNIFSKIQGKKFDQHIWRSTFIISIEIISQRWHLIQKKESMQWNKWNNL